MKSINMKPFVGVASGTLAVLLMFATAYMAHHELSLSGLYLTLLIGLCGVSIGWLLGLIASPQSKIEESRFQSYSKVVAGLLSGYFLGKLEPTLKLIFDNDQIIKSDIYALRLLLFVGCSIVGAITMFVYRSYLFRAEYYAHGGDPSHSLDKQQDVGRPA